MSKYTVNMSITTKTYILLKIFLVDSMILLYIIQPHGGLTEHKNNIFVFWMQLADGRVVKLHTSQ